MKYTQVKVALTRTNLNDCRVSLKIYEDKDAEIFGWLIRAGGANFGASIFNVLNAYLNPLLILSTATRTNEKRVIVEMGNMITVNKRVNPQKYRHVVNWINSVPVQSKSKTIKLVLKKYLEQTGAQAGFSFVNGAWVLANNISIPQESTPQNPPNPELQNHALDPIADVAKQPRATETIGHTEQTNPTKTQSVEPQKDKNQAHEQGNHEAAPLVTPPEGEGVSYVTILTSPEKIGGSPVRVPLPFFADGKPDDFDERIARLNALYQDGVKFEQLPILEGSLDEQPAFVYSAIAAGFLPKDFFSHPDMLYFCMAETKGVVNEVLLGHVRRYEAIHGTPHPDAEKFYQEYNEEKNNG